ncbi:MAG: DUF1549 and DUF1553 domain-containing protein [Pirellulaceae bacterium]
MRTRLYLSLTVCMTLVGASLKTAIADDIIAPIQQRFANSDVQETPSFQKHVVPLFGRLGCNGRACHGSFQGQGGFRLSLFGYDFKLDHDALFDKDSPRVDPENPLESLIIAKPTDEDMHEGGLRYEQDSWQYHVIRRWIEGGAEFKKDQVQTLTELKIVPSELLLSQSGEEVQLKAIAIWEDGTQEDVTPLCRFQSNDDQIATIDQNGLVTATNRGDTHLVISYDKAVVPVPVIRPVTELVGDKYPQVAAKTKVDELVIEKLRKLGVVPSEICTDAEFLRRIRLDLTGTLPTAKEVDAFLADESSDKRAKKVDELLETSAYAAWWTTQLCDFTGNNTQNLNNVSPIGRLQSPSQDWYDWIHRRVEENVTYDKIVEGIVAGSNLQPEQSYTEYCDMMSDLYRDEDKSYADLPAMEYYWSRRDFNNNMEARAIGFAYSFMGLRIQCAQCHKHPFDVWSKDDFHQFKNFFARIQPAGRNAPREYRDEYNKLIAQLDVKGKRNNELQRELPALLKKGKTIPFGAVSTTGNLLRTRNPDEDYPEFDHGKLLGGDVVDVLKVDDPRQVVMDWLRGPDNPFFAKAFVNRVWASYFNAGIVNPPDDLNLANPPSNKALLDYLSKAFIESGFDMKSVHRMIANSDTYQRSWQPNETNKLDERNFSRAVARRLPAEVAYDAIQQATASDERAKLLCESVDGRAIAIAGASARGRANGPDFALSVFGKSTRESNCDCDRSSEPSLLQTVFLQNDRDVLGLVDANRGTWLDGVARDLKPQPANGASAERRIESLENQRRNAAKQLARLTKARNEPQLTRAKQRIAQLDKQLAALKAQAAQADEPSLEGVDEKVSHYIVDAYLRTLSRYPNESEMARSTAYVHEASDPVEGLGDILWALLNTKEFIVNH